MSSNVYPPPTVTELDKGLEQKVLAIQPTVAKKYGLTDDAIFAIVAEVLNRSAELIFQPMQIGTFRTGSGFPAVEPAHFRKLEYTRVYRFAEIMLEDRAAAMMNHETGLMIQEIKDLRNVLKIQFHYDWAQHRAMFPLIAQSGI